MLGRLLPPPLAALDRGDRPWDGRLIRQVPTRNYELPERGRVIALAIIMNEALREVRLRQFRLQPERFVGRGPRLLQSGRHRIDRLVKPALQAGELRMGERKLRIEREHLLEQRLRLFALFG